MKIHENDGQNRRKHRKIQKRLKAGRIHPKQLWARKRERHL